MAKRNANEGQSVQWSSQLWWHMHESVSVWIHHSTLPGHIPTKVQLRQGGTLHQEFHWALCYVRQPHVSEGLGMTVAGMGIHQWAGVGNHGPAASQTSDTPWKQDRCLLSRQDSDDWDDTPQQTTRTRQQQRQHECQGNPKLWRNHPIRSRRREHTLSLLYWGHVWSMACMIHRASTPKHHLSSRQFGSCWTKRPRAPSPLPHSERPLESALAFGGQRQVIPGYRQPRP